MQEKDHQPGGDPTALQFGTIVGLVPWLAIGGYLAAGDVGDHLLAAGGLGLRMTVVTDADVTRRGRPRVVG